MIASVSTFARSSGATTPVTIRNGSMSVPLPEPAHVDEMTSHCSGRGHRGTHEVRAAAGTLAAFEIAVRRGRATLAGFEPVVVHREAHRASGLAPFEARIAEDTV